jgi:hypothetical protein
MICTAEHILCQVIKSRTIEAGHVALMVEKGKALVEET